MDPVQWNQGQEGVSVFLILSSFVWGSRTSVPCCWSHKAIHATQVRGVFWKVLTFMGFWACAVTTWCSKTNRKGDGEVQSVWEGNQDKSVFQRRPRPATKNSMVFFPLRFFLNMNCIFFINIISILLWVGLIFTPVGINWLWLQDPKEKAKGESRDWLNNMV